MDKKIHPCCDPTTPSPIWEGTPTGKIITVEGIETYVSQPRPSEDATQTPSTETQKRIILFLTEGHGIYLPNAQLLADSFASHLHCDVLMPDQFAGQARLPKNIIPHFPSGKEEIPGTIPWTDDPSDPNYEHRGQKVPLKENIENSDAYPFFKPPWWRDQPPDEFEKWKLRHEVHVTDPILEKIVNYIHATYGKEVKIGGVGYCFGGRYVMRLMGQGVIDVGVVNHPSFFTMDEVAKLGDAKRLAIFAAEKDDILPKEKRWNMEEVLTSAGTTWTCTVFGGTEHGFSVRGDLSVKEVRLAKEKAFRGAVDWFRDWL